MQTLRGGRLFFDDQCIDLEYSFTAIGIEQVNMIAIDKQSYAFAGSDGGAWVECSGNGASTCCEVDLKLVAEVLNHVSIAFNNRVFNALYGTFVDHGGVFKV